MKPGWALRVPLLANSIPYAQGVPCDRRALRTRLGWVAAEVELHDIPMSTLGEAPVAIQGIRDAVELRRLGRGYMSINYARIAQATLSKRERGYKVTLVVREDGRTRNPVEKEVANLVEAEALARAYAAIHGVPWYKVVVISQ